MKKIMCLVLVVAGLVSPCLAQDAATGSGAVRSQQPKKWTKVVSRSRSEFGFGIPIFLPRDVVQAMQRAKSGEPPDPSAMWLDYSEFGDSYEFIQLRRGYRYIIEGGAHILRSQKPCTGASSDNVRNMIWGTTEPRNLGGKNEEDPPSRESLFRYECTGYRVRFECLAETSETDCRQILNGLRRLANYENDFVVVAKLININGFSGTKPRPQPTAPSGKEARPTISRNEFAYVEPGLLRVRQYMWPERCGGTALAYEFYSDAKTNRSRLVYAGPDLMERFPIDLKAARLIVLNSQIFDPGGAFILTQANRQFLRRHDVVKNKATVNIAMLYEDLKKTCGNVRFEAGSDGKPILGKPGEPNDYGKSSNFQLPWVDTFCEFRGADEIFDYCKRDGRGESGKGVRFGVDIRADTQDLSVIVPVIAVTSGNVHVEQANCRDPKVKDIKDCPAADTDEGQTVVLEPNYVDIIGGKVRFKYRHMNPDKSPFNQKNEEHLNPKHATVQVGQIIGYMSDYHGGPHGTSKHLHFEIEYSRDEEEMNESTRKSVASSSGRTSKSSSWVKAPAFPSLIVAYLRERHNYSVDLTKLDRETGLPRLPPINPNEITLEELKASGAAINRARPLTKQPGTNESGRRSP